MSSLLLFIFFLFLTPKINLTRPYGIQFGNTGSNKILNQKLENIDISDVSSITLYPNNAEKINIRTKNYFKMVKSLVNETGKTEFAPGELSQTYSYILDNYETQLPYNSWIKIRDTLAIFVKNGGRVEIGYGESTQRSESNEFTDGKEPQNPFLTGAHTLWTLIKIVIFIGTLCLYSVGFFCFSVSGIVLVGSLSLLVIIPLALVLLKDLSSIYKRYF